MTRSRGRLFIVNPNRSEVCTRGIHAAALRHVSADISVQAVTSVEGPAYVETPADEDVAARAVLEVLRAEAARAAGEPAVYVIACSSDPGLEAARRQFPVPVLGIGESALLLARGLGVPYGILTNVRDDEIYMRDMAARYGLSEALVTVEATGHSVEAFDRDEPEAAAGLLAAATRSVSAGARALCLGCAAMAGLEERIEAETGVPVFEGVASATRLASVYLALGMFARGEAWSPTAAGGEEVGLK